MGTACWLWTGYKTKKGYGHFRFNKRTVPAHRFTCQLTMGMYWPMLCALQVDHRCHNPPCVNPLHLRMATNKQQHENLSGSNKNSQSGIRGVFRDRKTGYWIATVMHHGKLIHVGRFNGPKEAESAVIAKRNQLFTHNDADPQLTPEQCSEMLANCGSIKAMPIDIEWEDPPAGRRREDFTAFANELRANPGRWAKWPKLYRNSTSIGAIRKNIADGTERAPVGFRDAYWDAVVRNSVLYVRYLGDTQVEAEETLARDE